MPFWWYRKDTSSFYKNITQSSKSFPLRPIKKHINHGLPDAYIHLLKICTVFLPYVKRYRKVYHKTIKDANNIYYNKRLANSSNIAKLINKFFQIGTFSSYIKTSIIILLNKGGDNDQAFSYLPIALPAMERLFKKRLSYLTSLFKLAPFQAAFNTTIIILEYRRWLRIALLPTLSILMEKLVKKRLLIIFA